MVDLVSQRKATIARDIKRAGFTRFSVPTRTREEIRTGAKTPVTQYQTFQIVETKQPKVQTDAPTQAEVQAKQSLISRGRPSSTATFTESRFDRVQREQPTQTLRDEPPTEEEKEVRQTPEPTGEVRTGLEARQTFSTERAAKKSSAFTGTLKGLFGRFKTGVKADVAEKKAARKERVTDFLGQDTVSLLKVQSNVLSEKLGVVKGKAIKQIKTDISFVEGKVKGKAKDILGTKTVKKAKKFGKEKLEKYTEQVPTSFYGAVPLISGKVKDVVASLPPPPPLELGRGPFTKEELKISKVKREKQAEFAAGVTEGLLYYPKEHPIKTVAFFALPFAARGVEAGLTLAGTKGLTVVGKYAPQIVTKGLYYGGRVTVGGAKVGMGVAYVSEKAVEYKLAPTPRARGRVFASVGAELGVATLGHFATATTRAPFEVSAGIGIGKLEPVLSGEFATKRSVSVISSYGDISKKLYGVKLEPTSNIMFGKVKGISRKQVRGYEDFAVSGQVETFAGTTTIPAYASPKLQKQFFEWKQPGDVDVILKTGIELPTKITIH